MATKKQNQEQNVNTSQSVKNQSKPTSAQVNEEIRKAGEDMNKAEKEKVKVPEFVRKRVGNNIPVGVNGAVVHVPVGEEVEIPKPMAEVLRNTIDNLKV